MVVGAKQAGLKKVLMFRKFKSQEEKKKKEEKKPSEQQFSEYKEKKVGLD